MSLCFFCYTGIGVRQLWATNARDIEYEQSSVDWLLLWCVGGSTKHTNDGMSTVSDSVSIVSERVSEHDTKSSGPAEWLFVWQCQQRCSRRIEFRANWSGRRIHCVAVFVPVDGKFGNFLLFRYSFGKSPINYCKNSNPETRKKIFFNYFIVYMEKGIPTHTLFKESGF